MKIKRSKKPTNKDIQQMIQELQYRLVMTHSQLDNLTHAFSEFLEFTHKKAKFMEHLNSKAKQAENKQPEEVGS